MMWVPLLTHAESAVFSQTRPTRFDVDRRPHIDSSVASVQNSPPEKSNDGPLKSSMTLSQAAPRSHNFLDRLLETKIKQSMLAPLSDDLPPCLGQPPTLSFLTNLSESPSAAISVHRAAGGGQFERRRGNGASRSAGHPPPRTSSATRVCSSSASPSSRGRLLVLEVATRFRLAPSRGRLRNVSS